MIKVVWKVLSGFYFLLEFLKTYLSINLAIGKNRMSIEKTFQLKIRMRNYEVYEVQCEVRGNKIKELRLAILKTNILVTLPFCCIIINYLISLLSHILYPYSLFNIF